MFWFNSLGSFPFGKWRLEGYDTFSRQWYALPHKYWNRKLAIFAARLYLKEIKKNHPTKTSGGHDGILDRVILIDPDGRRERIFLKNYEGSRNE